MYTVYIDDIGEVVLHLKATYINGSNIYILGHDTDHNRIMFIMDKICYPADQPYDCGYCHIISYIKNNIKTQCNIYKALC